MNNPIAPSPKKNSIGSQNAKFILIHSFCLNNRAMFLSPLTKG